MKKPLTEQQVTDLVKLKFGREVSSHHNLSYASNAKLAKIFGISATKVRELYLARFEEMWQKQLPFLQRLRAMKPAVQRKRWGYRFLKPHEVDWLVSNRTLRQ